VLDLFDVEDSNNESFGGEWPGVSSKENRIGSMRSEEVKNDFTKVSHRTAEVRRIPMPSLRPGHFPAPCLTTSTRFLFVFTCP
jgi:hypothetical protein